jgi:hypothetical protein
MKYKAINIKDDKVYIATYNKKQTDVQKLKYKNEKELVDILKENIKEEDIIGFVAHKYNSRERERITYKREGIMIGICYSRIKEYKVYSYTQKEIILKLTGRSYALPEEIEKISGDIDESYTIATLSLVEAEIK